jgi:rhamnosyltransferase
MRDVTILLLTRNGAGTLRALLDGVRKQDYDGEVTVLAVDSGSTDGTLEILRPRVARLISVEAGSFNHGETRNLGLRAATSPAVVLLVQDAVPAAPDWLRQLVRPLEQDARIAATWSRQVARPRAGPLTRMQLERWPGTSSVSRVSMLEDPAAFGRMTPWQRFELCAFDNVCSCIRRSVWEQHPFPRASIGEDVEWARDVLLGGHRIAFVAESVVQHSHERSSAYEFERTLLIHHRLRALFGLSTVPGLYSLTRAVASSAAAHAACLRRGTEEDRSVRQWARAFGLSLAWPLGQYLGARLADWGVRVDGLRGI